MTRGELLEAITTERRRPAWVRERPDAWRLAVGTVCVGAFMGQLDASIVTVAIPSLERSLDVSVGAATWVGLAYLVALVSLVAAAGRLADVHGRKLVYLYGFAVFTVASAACALAPSLAVLVVFRAIQGVGAAMLQANSVALVALAAPREKLGRALGVQGAAQALGLAAGPTVGGLLLAAGGWRLLFVVNVPTGLAALALGWFLLPRSAHLHRARPDRAGLALLAPATALVLVALSLGGAGDLGSVPAAVLGLLGVGLVAAFVRRERRTAEPLVDVRVLASRAVGSRLLAAVTSFTVLFGALLAAPFLLERALHLGPAAAGATLAALPVAIGVVAPLAGRAAERHSTRALTVSGALVCAAALGLAAVAHGSAWCVAAELAALGVGLGLFTPANNHAVLASVPPRDTGAVSGLLNMARGLGTGVGLAVASAVLGLDGAVHGFEITAAVLAAIAMLTAVLALADPSRASPQPGDEAPSGCQERTSHQWTTSVKPSLR